MSVHEGTNQGKGEPASTVHTTGRGEDSGEGDNGEVMARLQLSEDAKTLFKKGISMHLSRWSALQLAIEEEWGGRNSREKALQLELDIFNWFAKTKGDDDLEDLLDKAMLLSLNTQVDDGSIEEVSYKLLSMHEECLVGDYGTIERLREITSQARPVQHVRQMESDDEEDDDDGDMMSDVEDDDDDDDDDGDNDGEDMIVDVPGIKTNQIPMHTAISQPNPSNAAPAEDGWEVVTSKKNKGRRN